MAVHGFTHINEVSVQPLNNCINIFEATFIPFVSF